MAKAKFSRDGEGGYTAHYQIGNREFKASFVKAGEGEKQWKVSEGFASSDRLWDKLRDLKAEWADLCESDASPDEPAPAPAPPPAPASSGPPKLSGPPALGGPPKLSGPPSIKPPAPAENERVIGGKDTASSPAPSETRGEPSNASGDDAYPTPAVEGGYDPFRPVTTAKFEEYLKQQNKLCSGGTPKREHEFFCNKCKMHNAGLWTKAEDGTLLPPCRCEPPALSEGGYVPDSLDPRMWGLTRSGSFRTPSPVGALDMVYDWMRRNPDACTPKGTLVEPWATVQRVLWDLTGYREYRPSLWCVPNSLERKDPLYQATFNSLDHHKIATKKEAGNEQDSA